MRSTASPKHRREVRGRNGRVERNNLKMNTLNPFVLVPPAITLLFAVFGWRIAREIAIGDQGRRTWLLVSDFLDLLTLVALLGACVIHFARPYAQRAAVAGRKCYVLTHIGLEQFVQR